MTGAWEIAPVNRLGTCVGRGTGGFTIYRPEHWAFAAAQVGYGDVIGAAARIFGYEVDGLDYRFEDGLPFATCSDGAVQEIEILALGLATNIEADHNIWGETPYIGAADAAFKAMALYGEVTPQALDACTRGNGMIIHWKKGAGAVFTAATCEWVAGLVRNDIRVIAVTRNVLDRFGVG